MEDWTRELFLTFKALRNEFKNHKHKWFLKELFLRCCKHNDDDRKCLMLWELHKNIEEARVPGSQGMKMYQECGINFVKIKD